MRGFFFFIFLVHSLIGKEIELFIYWKDGAKGQELFPLEEGIAWNQLSLESRLRRRLVEKGVELKSWELPFYRPWLLCWKEVHSWVDFFHWIGWSLPREQLVSEETEYCVFWGLGPVLKHLALERLPKEKTVFFAWEPPVVEPESHDPQILNAFGKIFTWDDDLVDGVRYFKFFYPVLRDRIEVLVPFEQKKFCTMINTRITSKRPKELYNERQRVAQFYEGKPPGEFDLYGRGWKPKKFRNLKGFGGDKLEILKQYKFSICYENTRDMKGYITEKIFDCFAAGVVPVYWGASNVEDYIPSDCFIDRRKFGSDEEVYQFLKRMTSEEYQGYLDRTALFLKSDRAQLFSSDHFVDTFVDQL